MGLPASASFAPFDPLNQTYSAHFHTHVLAPLERQGVDFWWLDWQQVCLSYALCLSLEPSQSPYRALPWTHHTDEPLTSH